MKKLCGGDERKKNGIVVNATPLAPLNAKSATVTANNIGITMRGMVIGGSAANALMAE